MESERSQERFVAGKDARPDRKAAEEAIGGASVEAVAAGERQDDLSLSLEIAQLLFGDYGEEHGFDAETCAEIAEQPFEEAFQTAYSYLTQAGLDVDDVLARFIDAR